MELIGSLYDTLHTSHISKVIVYITNFPCCQGNSNCPYRQGNYTCHQVMGLSTRTLLGSSPEEDVVDVLADV